MSSRADRHDAAQRILFVIPALGEGGTEMSLAELLPFVRDAGIEPTVALLKSRGSEGIEEAVRQDGFDVRVLDSTGHARQVIELRRLVQSLRPALMHTMLYWASFTGRLAAMHPRVPVLTSLVNTPFEVERDRYRTRMARLKRRVALDVDRYGGRLMTTHFHAVSNAVREAALAHHITTDDRITVVHRGRATARLGTPSHERRLRVRGSLGLPSEAEVIIHVGRHEPGKDHTTLVEALAPLLAERASLQVLLVGRDGSTSAQLRSALARVPDADRIHVLGHRSDVGDVLAAADLFVLPSIYEGLPGAAIEAMALGLAVVASDIPPTREVVEDGRSGLLVAPGSPHALRDAMRVLLDDTDRRTHFGEEGNRIYHEKFTIEASAAGMLDLYRSMTGDRAKSGQSCGSSS
jgi:glycosyltransferase involved in cell wall biosynthesis